MFVFIAKLIVLIVCWPLALAGWIITTAIKLKG